MLEGIASAAARVTSWRQGSPDRRVRVRSRTKPAGMPAVRSTVSATRSRQEPGPRRGTPRGAACPTSRPPAPTGPAGLSVTSFCSKKCRCGGGTSCPVRHVRHAQDVPQRWHQGLPLRAGKPWQTSQRVEGAARSCTWLRLFPYWPASGLEDLCEHAGDADGNVGIDDDLEGQGEIVRDRSGCLRR